MRRIACVLMVLVTLTSCVTVNSRPTQGDRTAELKLANATYDRAIVASDAAALDRLYASDFLFVGDHAELRNKR